MTVTAMMMMMVAVQTSLFKVFLLAEILGACLSGFGCQTSSNIEFIGL